MSSPCWTSTPTASFKARISSKLSGPQESPPQPKTSRRQPSGRLCSASIRTSGSIDLKSFKQLCKDLKPKESSLSQYYEQQFKLLGVDQEGLIDIAQFKRLMTTIGHKMSEGQVDSFLKQVRKEDNGKVRLQAVLDKLSAVNVLI